MALSNIPQPLPSIQAQPQKKGSNTIFFVLGGVVAIGFVVYMIYFFFSSPTEEQVGPVANSGLERTIAEASATALTNADAQAVEEAVKILEKVRLDAKLFEDKRFLSLQQTPITVPEPTPPRRRIFELRSDTKNSGSINTSAGTTIPQPRSSTQPSTPTRR